MITYEDWRKTYLTEDGEQMYVAYNACHLQVPESAVTASEANGYGLIISVLQRNRSDFDKLLAFCKRFQTPKGLMYWQIVRENGKIHPNSGTLNSATDGDLDVAYALFLAAKVWKAPEYKVEAQRICAALLEHCFNNNTQMVTPGDWCIPGHELHKVVRTSDMLLSHFAMFAIEDEPHAEQWKGCLEATLQAIEQQLKHSSTGLMADFITYNQEARRFQPVDGKVLENDTDCYFKFNACRTPWRIAIYYMESGNKRVLPILQALVKFFEAQEHIFAGYTLEGKPLVNWNHMAFTGPVWCLCKVMESPHLGRIAGLMDDLGATNYFGDTIQLLCSLQTAQLKNGPGDRQNTSAMSMPTANSSGSGADNRDAEAAVASGAA